jgi:hypothetical protein
VFEETQALAGCCEQTARTDTSKKKRAGEEKGKEKGEDEKGKRTLFPSSPFFFFLFSSFLCSAAIHVEHYPGGKPTPRETLESSRGVRQAEGLSLFAEKEERKKGEERRKPFSSSRKPRV